MFNKIELVKELRNAGYGSLLDCKRAIDNIENLPLRDAMYQYNQLMHRGKQVRVIVSKDGTVLNASDCVVVSMSPENEFKMTERMSDSERFYFARDEMGGRYV